MMTLLPALTGAFPDRPDAVRVGSQAISWEGLRGAATAVADRVAGAPAVAVDATARLQTVVATVGALIAGVPLVPVPADSGPVERDHILAAYVVASGISGRELIDFVAQRLSIHKRPRRVHLIDALPRNPMGKVQKARLVDV